MTEIIEGTGVPKLVLGQKLYIPCPRQRIVVEATIEELHDIYGNGTTTIWHSYGIGLMNEASIRIQDPGEKFVVESSTIAVEKIPSFNLKLLNQFPWTNYPTWGHAAYIGSDAFITLHEARAWISPSNKKHLVRRLKQATNWTKKEFPNYRLKSYKIYVRNF